MFHRLYRLFPAITLPLLLTAFMVSCTPPQTSDVTVAGGEETTADPAVVLFEVDTQKGRVCTGTVVSTNAAIMAGHCIKSSTERNGVRLLRASREVRSVQIYTWKGLVDAETLTETTAARDLAVVVFPANTFVGALPNLRTKIDAIPGEEVRIVGYGAAGFDGLDPEVAKTAGVKRAGTNRISDVDPEKGLITIKTAISDIGPRNAMAASGDSGGPLFDSSGLLIGVAAGMYLEDADGEKTGLIDEGQNGLPTPVMSGAETAVNLYVDLTSEASLKLLTYATSPERGEFAAFINGFSQDQNVALDATDITFIERGASTTAATGDIVALCGGGGGGGFDKFGGDGFGGDDFGDGGLSDFDNLNNNNLNNNRTPTPTPTPTLNNNNNSDSQLGGPNNDDLNNNSSDSSNSEAQLGRSKYQSSCATSGCHAGQGKKSASAWTSLVANNTIAAMNSIMSSLSSTEKAQITAYLNSSLP